MMINRLLWRLAVASLLTLAAPPAHAVESSFGPAYDAYPLLGAGAAKGAVIYNHGKAHLADPNTTIPTYVDRVRRAGWDVFALVRPYGEDNVYDSTQALIRAAKQLKAKGYGKVATLGQSYGGWISIAAAAEEDSLFHAVVVTAPAAYGSSEQAALTRIGANDWHRNAEIVSIAKGIKSTPVMAFFFAKDDYDPGGRGPALRDALAQRPFRHAVIDQPDGLKGHAAARGQAFAARFGSCVADFLDSAQAAGAFACPDKPAVTTIALPVEAKPLASAPGAFAPLLGTWSGLYPNGRELLFAVEAINGDAVTAIYAWGGRTDKAGDTGGWERITGRVVDGKLHFENSKRVLLFSALPDGQMEAVWAKPDGSNPLKASLQRLP